MQGLLGFKGDAMKTEKTKLQKGNPIHKIVNIIKQKGE